MTRQHCGSEPPRAADLALEAMTRRLASFQRLSWREALGGVVAAPTRLHRYRELRTRMLHDALCARDCDSDTAANDRDE